MQTPTHLMMGVRIDQTVPEIKPGLLRRLVIAFLSITSHAILDALSALTYHPPEASPGDRFWLGYHTMLTGLTFRVWIKNQQYHKWAMICSVLPDLDWLFIKIPNLIRVQTIHSQRPVLHEALSEALLSIPPLKLLKRLPNLRQAKVAATLELIAYVFLSGE